MRAVSCPVLCASGVLDQEPGAGRSPRRIRGLAGIFRRDSSRPGISAPFGRRPARPCSPTLSPFQEHRPEKVGGGSEDGHLGMDQDTGKGVLPVSLAKRIRRFSVSASRLDAVRQYISQQDSHHATDWIPREFRKFLVEYEVEYEWSDTCGTRESFPTPFQG